ncbi:hypothetical protein FSP39_001977 [Pinctada imbricata]|uniref:Transmembrane protein 45B n=1 Tax=Pinctada imbricata TaxID=66713 RepID=A0AA88YGM1_PINIB|nr:hypothetical protein FSP39_001977 [Pinctada imbricata]
MGTFGGHALPGSFFILFAVWWTVQMFHRYFLSLRRNTRFRSTVTFPCTCLCGKFRDWPIEAVIKLIFVSLGFSLEIITGSRHGKFVILGNGQHATMFFFFGMSGCIDLLLYFKAPSIPKNLDYVVTLLALGVEGLLFKFHLHGRNELDVRLHTLLIYTIYLNIIAVCLEIRFRTSLLAALGRAYCFFLQGTWFWQVGFILYNPDPNAEKWKGDDHDGLMIATMFFTWHAGAVFLTILAIGGFVVCFHRAFNGYIYTEIGAASERLLSSEKNGRLINSLNDNEDSDSDIEFQKPIKQVP